MVRFLLVGMYMIYCRTDQQTETNENDSTCLYVIGGYRATCDET